MAAQQEFRYGRGAGDGRFAGAKLLFSDARVAYLLLNEARYRAINRVFGVSREDSLVVTMIAVATVAQPVATKLQKMARGPSRPTLGGSAFGAGMMRETAHIVAGDWSRDTDRFGTLVGVVVVATAARPVIRATYHRARDAAHATRLDFDHRYGHLMRRNPSRRPAAGP